MVYSKTLSRGVGGPTFPKILAVVSGSGKETIEWPFITHVSDVDLFAISRQMLTSILCTSVACASILSEDHQSVCGAHIPWMHVICKTVGMLLM